MRDAPLPATLHDQHSEPRWTGYGLALLHSCELVKSCYHYGIVVKHDPDAKQGPGGRELHGLQLMDMAPTILEQLGVPIPADMQGKLF